jgi:hypothetical protein
LIIDIKSISKETVNPQLMAIHQQKVVPADDAWRDSETISAKAAKSWAPKEPSFRLPLLFDSSRYAIMGLAVLCMTVSFIGYNKKEEK